MSQPFRLENSIIGSVSQGVALGWRVSRLQREEKDLVKRRESPSGSGALRGGGGYKTLSAFWGAGAFVCRGWRCAVVGLEENQATDNGTLFFSANNGRSRISQPKAKTAFGVETDRGRVLLVDAAEQCDQLGAG